MRKYLQNTKHPRENKSWARLLKRIWEGNYTAAPRIQYRKGYRKRGIFSHTLREVQRSILPF